MAQLSVSNFISERLYVRLMDLSEGDELVFEVVPQKKKTHYFGGNGAYGSYMPSEQVLDSGGNGIDTISLESPLGQALKGKHAGDIVEYKNPMGNMERYQIIEISTREIRDFNVADSDKKEAVKTDKPVAPKPKYSKEETRAAAAYINSHLGVYLQGLGIRPRMRFRCFNPEHYDKNPSMTYYPDDQHVHCFACGATYDLIDLIGIEYCLNSRKEAFKKACELYNADSGKYVPVKAKEENIQTEEDKDREMRKHFEECDRLKVFFEEASKNIEKTTYHRGLSLRILNAFKVGYVENWRHPKAVSEGKNPPASPRLIVPTGEDSYLARDTREEIPPSQEQYKKMKYGTSYIFNFDELFRGKRYGRPVFVVEGEFDALSVIQAGCRAVALGSLSNAKLFLDLVEKAPEKPDFVIALDNEDSEPVKKALKFLEDGLQELNIKYIVANPAGDYKDANESLINEPLAFYDRVYKIEREIKQ